jgi:hypothetical protein
MKTTAKPGRKLLTACKCFDSFYVLIMQARYQYSANARSLQEGLLYSYLRNSEYQDAHRGRHTHISAQENAQKGVYMRIYCGLEDQLSILD